MKMTIQILKIYFLFNLVNNLHTHIHIPIYTHIISPFTSTVQIQLLISSKINSKKKKNLLI